MMLLSIIIAILELTRPAFLNLVDTSKQNVFDYDRKKFALLNENDKIKKLKEMMEKDKNPKANIQILREMKAKLTELDIKMKEALNLGQEDKKQKLQQLVSRINELKEVIQQHYNSLVLPTGATVDQALSPYENGINPDTSYESILTENSDQQESSSNESIPIKEQIEEQPPEIIVNDKPVQEIEEDLLSKQQEEQKKEEANEFKQHIEKEYNEIRDEYQQKK